VAEMAGDTDDFRMEAAQMNFTFVAKVPLGYTGLQVPTRGHSAASLDYAARVGGCGTNL
jgi:hypothetical protein